MFRLHTKQPLFNMEFFIIGATNMPRNEIEYKIKAMGGQMASRIHSYLTAVISNAEEVENSTGLMRDTFIHRVQVVPDSFLDEVMDNDPIEVIVQRNLNKKWSKHVRFQHFFPFVNLFCKDRIGHSLNVELKYFWG